MLPFAAIVPVLPRWRDTAMHVMAIVRALSLPGVRQIGCREAR
jgi:hypothetical protein